VQTEGLTVGRAIGLAETIEFTPVEFEVPIVFGWRKLLPDKESIKATDFMNSSFAQIYGPIAILMIAALGFAIAPLAMAWLWAKRFSIKKPGPVKNSVYECGLESKDDVLIQFRPEYYLYAIVFLIFDVEAIFVLPFAVAFTGLTVGASIVMLIFLLLLVEGLVWMWRKGILTWV
jgi:NADH:ubiquinone oxidoreductase subunit 3 (subunit A)